MLTPFSPTGSLFRPPSRTSLQSQLKGNAFNMGTGKFQQQADTSATALDADYAEKAKRAYADMVPGADPTLRDAFAGGLANKQQQMYMKAVGMFGGDESQQATPMKPDITPEMLQQYIASGRARRPMNNIERH